MPTIGALIERMAPCGTRPADNKKPDWGLIPVSPMDVFAITATLVDRCGAYRFVACPEGGSAFKPGLTDQNGKVQPGWREIAEAWAFGFFPGMNRSGRRYEEFLRAGREWLPELSEDDSLEYGKEFEEPYYGFETLSLVKLDSLQNLWMDLHQTNGCIPVVMAGPQAEGRDSFPAWWRSALMLLIVSDVAARGVGFRRKVREGVEAKETLWQAKWIMHTISTTDEPTRRYIRTLTDVIAPTFCAVMPKTRTSPLGCTLRSLTHNLALVPSSGFVEARWRVPAEEPFSPIRTGEPRAKKSLNLLLAPFPYRISPDCFRQSSPAPGKKLRRGAKAKEVVSESEESPSWGFFDVDQRWLRHEEIKATQAICDFMEGLVDEARKDFGDGIHAVVLPELALDKATMNKLLETFLKKRKSTGFEFLVSGTSQDPESATGEMGNFVAVRGASFPKKSGKAFFSSAREKHHRWKLDRRQIERYGLSASLPPLHNWWESIPLRHRVVEFFEPRAHTSLTVLICEDLARTDPCQAVVRAVGPNLVIVLLMDGPQRKSRWPGHYAGVLADDPGSSVLTLTSYGLIARGAAGEQQERSIALFRNSKGQERELFLPYGYHALAVRLEATTKVEHTLDGRGDGGSSYIWELREVIPIRAQIKPNTSWIVEGII